MKQFLFILKLFGIFAFLVFMVLSILGSSETALYFIIIALFCFALVLALHISQLYHHYFINRRRS